MPQPAVITTVHASMKKADYLALRELTLSWDLPKAWTSKAFIQNASVYVTGQNLFYVTGYTGTSPEPVLTNSDNNENLYGVDQGRYPTPRTVLFGLSVTFLKLNTTIKE